jgi:hypothetical protein
MQTDERPFASPRRRYPNCIYSFLFILIDSNMDVSRYILVLDISILKSINMNRREYLTFHISTLKLASIYAPLDPCLGLRTVSYHLSVFLWLTHPLAAPLSCSLFFRTRASAARSKRSPAGVLSVHAGGATLHASRRGETQGDDDRLSREQDRHGRHHERGCSDRRKATGHCGLRRGCIRGAGTCKRRPGKGGDTYPVIVAGCAVPEVRTGLTARERDGK